MNRYIQELQPLITLIVMIAAIYICTYGLTMIIEVGTQLCESLYIVGHDLGVFLKSFFS